MKRAILFCMVLGLLVAGSGCCGFHRRLCEPFGPGTGCDPTHCGVATCGPVCGPSCGPVCGPACGPVCGPACGPACDACGGPCDATCCDPCCAPCGPLSWLFAIFTCGYPDSGCGEVYWGDFHGDPPDCCDPCDRCGNWTGATGGCAGGTCGTADGGGPIDYRYSASRAPRLISQTDRVVGPTPARPVGAPRVASSRPAAPRR